IAAVIDARIRQRIDPLLPQPQGPWTSRVPHLPDPPRRAYLTGIAALMDDRIQRLGQHTAQIAPAWAITALGPVPADPAARPDWAPRHVGEARRLSRLGAFDAALSAIRAAAEADTARKADDRGRAARHEHLAASYCAMRDHYQLQEQALAQAMADRQEWEQVT